MKFLKKYSIALVVVLFATAAYADVPKTLHVIKAKIKTDTESFIRYAVILGELPLNDYAPDSVFEVYKKNPKLLKHLVDSVMGINNFDSISLYPRFFRIIEKSMLLLPEDLETKIARNQIREIALLEYIKFEEFNSRIFTEILSSDSTWLNWKVVETEYFSTTGGYGICGHTIHYFNKPDKVSRQVVQSFKAAIEKDQLDNTVPEEEMIKFRKRLRKLRIVVAYYCGC